MKTTNGGTIWFSQTSVTTNDLYSVKFIDSNKGWAVGWFGKILKTIDGGSNWSSQSSVLQMIFTQFILLMKQLVGLLGGPVKF